MAGLRFAMNLQFALDGFVNPMVGDGQKDVFADAHLFRASGKPFERLLHLSRMQRGKQVTEFGFVRDTNPFHGGKFASGGLFLNPIGS